MVAQEDYDCARPMSLDSNSPELACAPCPQEAKDEDGCVGPMSLDSNSSSLSTCAPSLREWAELQAEVKALRDENMWLRRRINEEASSWRLCRVSSPLTSVRFGASLDEPYWCKEPQANGAVDAFEAPDARVSVAWESRQCLPPPDLPCDSRRREGDGWRWWPTWCPNCRRPLDVSTFKHGDAWEADEKWSAEKAAEAEDGKGEAVAMQEEPAVVAAAEGGPKAAVGGKPPADAAAAAPRAGPDSARAAAAAGVVAGAAAAAAPLAARYAYVAALWGYNPGFSLGALVLGAALRNSGTKHDLVLVHTDDIPASACELLGKVWRLRQVEYVNAHEGLFSSMGGRFDGVFTKLHALGLTEYAKVVVLDLDITVLSCPDDLFDLPAPAAMSRAVRGGTHGARLDGRHFFAGEKLDPESAVYTWGQAGGINAGVMLLAPSQALYERVLKEVCMPINPAHIPGNGPEQDFLSRLFAPWWTHISVAYNYQLHRTFHALEAGVQNAASILGVDGSQDPDWNWSSERLTLGLDDIKLIHFSGSLKMWDRDFGGTQDDSEFADQVLRDCAGDYCRLWMDKGGRDYEYQEYQVRLEEDGTFVHSDPAIGKAVGRIIEHALGLATGAARQAVRGWQQALHSLPRLCPALPALPQMLDQLQHPLSLPGAPYELGARVEVWARGDWFKATVRATHEDKTVSVEFEEAGFWGCGARHVPSHRLRLPDAGSVNGSTS